ncbi:MAG: oxidoreductase [Alphaproteobacteria bacterium HGW-Alphaproteobacteria-16]|nr:MAG: oxidoreductase [Alphaproteobacteria bacterium HGW-Alphaproteobacteria-16]
MIGMSSTTGKTLSGAAHLAQSIGDILATPIGSRIMRRDYGSLLFELMDRPANAATMMLLRAATAGALRKWEPRIRLTRVQFSGDFAGGAPVVTIEGVRTDVPAPAARLSLSIPLRRAAAI